MGMGAAKPTQSGVAGKGGAAQQPQQPQQPTQGGLTGKGGAQQPQQPTQQPQPGMGGKGTAVRPNPNVLNPTGNQSGMAGKGGTYPFPNQQPLKNDLSTINTQPQPGMGGKGVGQAQIDPNLVPYLQQVLSGQGSQAQQAGLAGKGLGQAPAQPQAGMSGKGGQQTADKMAAMANQGTQLGGFPGMDTSRDAYNQSLATTLYSGAAPTYEQWAADRAYQSNLVPPALSGLTPTSTSTGNMLGSVQAPAVLPAATAAKPAIAPANVLPPPVKPVPVQPEPKQQQLQRALQALAAQKAKAPAPAPKKGKR